MKPEGWSRGLVLLVCLWCVAGQANAASGLEALLQDEHTLVFLAVNLFLTLYFAVYRFDRFAAVHGPEILTTVGIFGCFFGIALALLHFDPTDAQKSVPNLLEGVKTAFWASVTGVGGALVIRARHRFQKTPIPLTPGSPKAASTDDVVTALQALQRSLSGNEDGSLLSQLKLMRQEQSDQLNKLRSSFDTFAQRMAEDGSKALISALREVIADFNAKINEQFGENFKQLNAAVEKLVIWQQQYKEELDRLQALQKSTADDMRKSATAVAEVAAKSASLTEAARRLEDLLIGISREYALLQQGQQAVVKTLESMRDVTPTFAQKIDEMLAALRDGVKRLNADLDQCVKSLTNQMQISNAEMKSALVENVKSLTNQVQMSNAEMKTVLVDSVKKAQSDVNDQLTTSLQLLQTGVRTLDQSLQEELTKSLQTLGRQLASLSEKFVQDYAPLTEKLREVVRLAANQGGNRGSGA